MCAFEKRRLTMIIGLDLYQTGGPSLSLRVVIVRMMVNVIICQVRQLFTSLWGEDQYKCTHWSQCTLGVGKPLDLMT